MGKFEKHPELNTSGVKELTILIIITTRELIGTNRTLKIQEKWGKSVNYLYDFNKQTLQKECMKLYQMQN